MNIYTTSTLQVLKQDLPCGNKSKLHMIRKIFTLDGCHNQSRSQAEYCVCIGQANEMVTLSQL